MSHYLHIGWDRVVPADEIVGVFDFSSWRQSESNQSLIERAQHEQALVRIGAPRGQTTESFRTVIFCASRIFLSPIASTTLQDRLHRPR